MRSRLCELTKWVVCSLGTSSTAAASEACKLLISSCIAEMRVFASTRDFFKSFIPSSLVFMRSTSSWVSLFSSSISLFFFLDQLPALSFGFSMPGKLFRLVYGVEQALNTVSRSQALGRSSLLVRCVLSGSFSFAEALIGNYILFRHRSYYILLNSAVWSSHLHIWYT